MSYIFSYTRPQQVYSIKQRKWWQVFTKPTLETKAGIVREVKYLSDTQGVRLQRLWDQDMELISCLLPGGASMFQLEIAKPPSKYQRTNIATWSEGK